MSIPGLSHSSLALFKECPRCFWWEKLKRVKRPRGAFPTLPKGMDRVMKEQVETCIRDRQPVPALAKIPDSQPFSDRIRLEKFRHWQSFQTTLNIRNENVTVWGELDDLIEHLETSLVSPWDYKTKGDEPDDAYGKKWYNDQLDDYHLLLEGNDLKCDGKGYLSYGWPQAIIGGTVLFGWKNIVLETDPARSVDRVVQAVNCLLGPEPLPGVNYDYGAKPCDFCMMVIDRNPVSVMTQPPTKKPAKKTKGAIA